MALASFGTDGLRGVANQDLTAELALALGRATARILPAPTFLVGRDTRRSGPLLLAALSSGLATEGADVVDVGIIPTPGLAFLAASRGFPAAMVSASHNPFQDNGIKLFSAIGAKLSEEVESQVEEELTIVFSEPNRPPRRPTGYGVGRIETDSVMSQEYCEHLVSTLEGRNLSGLSIVLDCANGSAVEFAPRIFKSLGCTVHEIAIKPDGVNINEECGSTNPELLAQKVIEAGADFGLAFDGDADRLLAVDHTGSVIDGDVLLALFAIDMSEQGTLIENSVVVTVMTNLGFRLAMDKRGISVQETPVGDRHILAALDASGLSLGGEQSGHIVFRGQATTGDGILTGILLSDLVLRKGRSLKELSSGLIEHVPQVLVNVQVPNPDLLKTATQVWDLVAEIENELMGSGRVLLRASGTEPLVRVMVEAASSDQAQDAADRLCEAVNKSLADLLPAREG